MQRYPAIRGEHQGRDSAGGCENGAAARQQQHWANQRFRGVFWTISDSRERGQRDFQKKIDPPGSENAPAEAKKSSVLRVENGSMTNREVFNTDARRNLVMNDDVDHIRQHRPHDDQQRLRQAGPRTNPHSLAGFAPLSSGLRANPIAQWTVSNPQSLPPQPVTADTETHWR